MGKQRGELNLITCRLEDCNILWFPERTDGGGTQGGRLNVSSCYWVNDTLVKAAITSNFYSFDQDSVIVTGNYFRTDATKVPLQAVSGKSPEVYVVTNNVFQGPATITDWSGGTGIIDNNINEVLS